MVRFVRDEQRGLMIVLGVSLFIGALYFLATLIFWPVVDVTKDNPLPPVTVEQTVRPTDLDIVNEAFGPWYANETVTYNEAVLLHEDGSQAVSMYTVPFPSKAWQKTQLPPNITHFTDDVEGGRVYQFETDNGTMLVVYAEQPFIFEQFPQMIYLIDSDESVWTMTVAQAKTLKVSA